MFSALLFLLSLSLSLSTSLTYKHHRNYKSGLGYPLKEGLEQPYKVCMDHWNQLEAQRTNEDDKKKRKLKKTEKDKKKKKKEKDKKKRVKKRYVIYIRERAEERCMVSHKSRHSAVGSRRREMNYGIVIHFYVYL